MSTTVVIHACEDLVAEVIRTLDSSTQIYQEP